jgi:hypothetical protein
MVGRATALLIVLLALYYGASAELPNLDLWPRVAFLSALVVPAVFSLALLALPLRLDPRLPLATTVLAVLTTILTVASLDTAANFTKFATVAGLGWLAIKVFEHPGWVALVAIIIIPVDLISVLRGPTKVILEEQRAVFDYFSITFPVPGVPLSDGGFQLGLPDVLFFALFLAACARFALRTNLTWLLMTCSFGGTIALAILIDREGFAALPLLSAAFLLANPDLLIRSLRETSWRASSS